MGYETTLYIGDHPVAQWRKYASHLPVVLFTHDNLSVVGASDIGTDRDELKYETTVGDALHRLEQAGIGWSASVAAYASVRFSAFAEGALMASMREEADEVDYENAVREFADLPPEVDVRSLGLVLAQALTDVDSVRVPLFDDISFDTAIESSMSILFEVQTAANKIDGANPIATIRAAETWINLHHDAPLLAWPVLLSILLNQLDPNMSIVLDLTDDAYEIAPWNGWDSYEYAEHYWLSSTDSLAKSGENLGRLFAVLSSFRGNASREFWFAKAGSELQKLANNLAGSRYSSLKLQGSALEDLFEALLQTEAPEIFVVEKNFRTREEEIDLVLSNSLKDPFWVAQSSPLILVECKNWNKKVGVEQLRVFESKLSDRGSICRIGIFVSLAGFTETFLKRLKTFQRSDGLIFAISGDDLGLVISTKTRLTDWLRSEGLIRALGKS